MIFLSLLVTYCISGQVFCASKKKKGQTEASKMVTDVYAGEGDSVKLPSSKRTYFYKIDPEIIKDVENGSPESLRKAMQSLRKPEGDYEENEKVLTAISTKIMKIVWPSEKITWDSIEASEENSYMGAITFAEKGIFDSSTENIDFLSTVLPALAVKSPVATAEVIEQCKNALIVSLNFNTESVLANYLLGCVYISENNFAQAEKCLKIAYDKAPENKELGLAYASILRKNNDVYLAAYVMQSLKADSNDIDVLKENAYIAFEKRDLVNAEQYVARVLQQTPNNLEFVLFRAKILIEKNDFIHAVSLLDMYSRQNDSSLDYLLLRAKVQLDWSKNTALATTTVEKTLQLYPDNSEALMLAARISSETDSPVMGKYADELASKILEISPDNKKAMEYALAGLAQRENWKSAYEIAEKLINMPDVSKDVILEYVNLCLKLNKKNEAFEFAKKMQIQYPEDEQVIQAYLLAYSATGNREAVIKYIDTLLATASVKMKSNLYYQRSFLQLTEDNSLADLRSSLISNPRNSDALFRLYEIYYGKSDFRKAQYYLRQVVAIKPNDSSVRKLNEALTQLIK